MKQALKTLNRLQVPTWNALRINAASLSELPAGLPAYTKEPLGKIVPGLLVSRRGTNAMEELPAAIRDVGEYVRAHANQRLHLTIPEGVTLPEPVVLDYRLDAENALLLDEVTIEAAAHSSAVIVLRYTSESDTGGFHAGLTCVEAAEGASLRVIKLQMLSKRCVHADAVGVRVEKDARADVLLAELGAQQTVSGCSVALIGDRAQSELDGLYLGSGEQRLDTNYRIEYRGKQAQGRITQRGVLLDKARKTAKSTLDFITGCVGAKGREEESVLVLSPDAVNLSAPLLLCGEDDVEGQHATSTGRPDSMKLFYLMSRGVSEAEARKLLALAAFAPILDKIEPEALRGQTAEAIREGMEDAEEVRG